MDAQKIVRLNVGGTVFQCYEQTLKTFEDSVLANLDETSPHFNTATHEYFFDRSPVLFNYILDSYRIKTIHLPHDVCGTRVKMELAYWGLSARFVSPCCWEALYRSDLELKTYRTLEDFYRGSTGLGLVRTKDLSFQSRAWLFLHEPRSSKYATVWAVFVSLVITLSVLVTAAASLPETYTHPYTPGERRTMARIYNILGWSNGSQVVQLTKMKHHPAVMHTDACCFFILTLELVVSAVVCPQIIDILRSWMHIAEFVCNVAFWYCYIAEVFFLGDIESDALLKVYILFKCATVLKLVRLLRIARHIHAFRIMGLTLKVSKQELGTLVLILFILATFFGMIVYLVEMMHEDYAFRTIFTAMYWAVITLTTVGYGDFSPMSPAGRAVAVSCAVFGILMLALPVGVIASGFFSLYNHHQYAKKYIKDNESTIWDSNTYKKLSKRKSKMFSHRRKITNKADKSDT